MKLQILVPQYRETDEVVDAPTEEWRDIEGYEGLYKISSYGRVYSVPRQATSGGIIKPSYSTSGYLQTHLCKDSKCKTFQIHRLVAKHFLENPYGLPEVNHKDECKNNNCVWNLEYCTRVYNQNYGTAIKRAVESHDYEASAKKSAAHHDYSKIGGKRAKSVLQMELDGTIVRQWERMRDIQRELGYSVGNISNACNGKIKSAYGFLWKFYGGNNA